MTDERDDEILTPRQVAKMLKVSLGWVSKHASGRYQPVLPSYKLGGAVRFKAREVLEFLERCKRAMRLGVPIQ